MRVSKALDPVLSSFNYYYGLLCDFFSSLPPFQQFLAMVAHQDKSFKCNFDTDGFMIGVDTLCSRTMSGCKTHFRSLRDPTTVDQVQGIGDSSMKIEGIGTFFFSLHDDDGKYHTFEVPNSLYVPGIKLPLLSPQHWAKEADDHKPLYNGTSARFDDDACHLYWKQGHYEKTIPYDPTTNTPIFKTVPGTTRYQAFEALHHSITDDIQHPEVASFHANNEFVLRNFRSMKT